MQILYHLGIAWDLRWTHEPSGENTCFKLNKILPEPVVPTKVQVLLFPFSFLQSSMHCYLMFSLCCVVFLSMVFVPLLPVIQDNATVLPSVPGFGLDG